MTKTPSLTIVTSFNEAIWNGHGKPCVMSWLEKLKGDFELHIYVDGKVPGDLPFTDPRVKVFFLDNHPEYTKFLRDTAHVQEPPNVPPPHQFRFQFRRFWPKVFAMNKTSFRPSTSYALWLDADILINKSVHIDKFTATVSDTESFSILDRGEPWGYCDSGFLLVRNHEGTEAFFEQLRNLYTSQAIFSFREWHDAYLITQLLKITFGSQTSSNYGDNVHSLCGLSKSLHPLDDSWLKDYMVHLKGVRKQEAIQTDDNQLQNGDAEPS